MMAHQAHVEVHLTQVLADVAEIQALPLEERKRRARSYNVHPDDIDVHLQQVIDRVTSVRVLDATISDPVTDFTWEVESQPQGAVRPAPN